MYEWIFDGIGTELIGLTIGALLGGIAGYTIGVRNKSKQTQKAVCTVGRLSIALRLLFRCFIVNRSPVGNRRTVRGNKRRQGENRNSPCFPSVLLRKITYFRKVSVYNSPSRG